MFLNPLFLLGSIAASIPLVIHLMHKRHSHTIMWPSLRFIAASNRRTARRRQVQELLLLILRMALLVLLSLALARPVLRAGGIGGEGAETAVVVVLDNSMSMAAQLGGDTSNESTHQNRFSRAKAAAEQILRGLPAGASSALRLADGTESAAAHALSKNRNAAIAALRRAEVAEARGDVGARVSKAVVDASKEDAPNAEVYILTDMQSAAFARSPISTRSKNRAVSVLVVDCGGEPFRGVAVTSVAARARRFVAGAPLSINVRMRNFSPAPEERRVVLEIDGEGARAERLVKMEPGGAVGFSFQLTLDRAGEHTGRVYASPSDELPPDDTRHFRLHLADHIPVYVVERMRSAIPSARSSYFISLALNPSAVLAPRAGQENAPLRASPIAPKVVYPTDLASTPAYGLLKETQVVILSDLAAMSQAEARLWVDFVKAGGSLIVFPAAAGGAGEGAENLNDALGAPFLPAEIGDTVGDIGNKADPRRIDVERVDFQHDEVVEVFRNAEATLKALSVWKHYDLTVSHAAAGRAVLALERGKAFLAARKLGKGEVYMFAVPAGLKWSDLPARSLFLPLVHSLVYRASAPREQERNFLAGTAAQLQLPAESAGLPVFVTWPGGRRTQVANKVTEQGTVEVDMPPLVSSGVYRVEWSAGGAEAGAAKIITLVANPDPEESDPARIGLSRVRELYADAAGAEPVLVAGPDDLDRAIGRVRKGFELWDYLLAFALSVALFECFFANKYAARSKSRPAAGGAGGQTIPANN